MPEHQDLRRQHWQGMALACQSHAALMSKRGTPEIRETMLQLAARFANQDAPETDDESLIRARQQSWVSGVIGGLSQADFLMRRRPDKTAEILERAVNFAAIPLPVTHAEHERLIPKLATFATDIATLCEIRVP